MAGVKTLLPESVREASSVASVAVGSALLALLSRSWRENSRCVCPLSREAVTMHSSTMGPGVRFGLWAREASAKCSWELACPTLTPALFP